MTESIHSFSRRKLLKIAGLSVLGGVTSMQSAVAACKHKSSGVIAKDVTDSADKPLDEFVVEVKHRWQSNDIALVIRNRGQQSATITHITPTNIELARGTLPIHTVLRDGPVLVESGQELEVPLVRHLHNTSVTPAASPGHFDRSLQRQLRQQLSIITDGNSLAAVTISPGPRIG